MHGGKRTDLKPEKEEPKRQEKFPTDYLFSSDNYIRPCGEFDLDKGFHWWHPQYLVSPYFVPDVPSLSKNEELALLQKQADHLTALLKDVKKRISTLKHDDTDEIPAFIPDCVNAT